MAALSARRPTRRLCWMSMLLLLVLLQMLTSLVLFAGVFIHSDEAVISPFGFCLIGQRGKLSCYESHRSSVSGAESEVKINILTVVVTLGLYVPVVLVAFALLAMLLAAYAKDRAALWFSTACQAASSLLILTGIIAFVVLNQTYVRWDYLTPWFFLCVGVQVELAITAGLTRASGTRLTSDWE